MALNHVFEVRTLVLELGADIAASMVYQVARHLCMVED
jgi:hypothetical protein